MTMMQFSLYRAAFQQMTPDEQAFAAELARMADNGEEEASKAFRRFALEVIRRRRAAAAA